MQEASCHEENWGSEIDAIDQEEGIALLVRCHLARVSQVCVPSEHERACEDDVETGKSLDSIEHREMLYHRLVKIRRVHRLTHLVWLHIHLVDIADRRK